MKLFKLMMLLCALLGLAACGGGETEAPKAAVVTAPTGTDELEWKKFVSAAIKPHYKQGTRVWNYLILPGGDNVRKLETLANAVRDGLAPPQLFVFAGPDAAVADLVIEGFKEGKPDTLGGNSLLFVGKRVDEARVRAAVEPSGMSFLFHPID